MSQGPMSPNLTKKVQKEVSQMANRKLSCAMLYRWFKCKLKPPKNSQANGSLRENISIFFIAPLLSRRNVGTTSKERNQFAKIPDFLIEDKYWWPLSTLKLISEKHQGF